MITIVACINFLALGMAIGEGAAMSDMAGDWVLLTNFLFATVFGALAIAKELA